MNRNLIFAPVLVQVLLTLMGKGLRPLYPPLPPSGPRAREAAHESG
jgi:hypothetical protein